MDIAAPSVLLAQAIGRWGNFMNQEAYGPVTTRSFLEGLHLPDFIIDNVYIEGAYRQPTFLYESMWGVLGFILLVLLRKKKKGLFKEGEVALSYVIWYSFGTAFSSKDCVRIVFICLVLSVSHNFFLSSYF